MNTLPSRASPSEALAEIEAGLLRRADAVVVSAERLFRSKSPANPRTFLVRHGVDYDHFRGALAPETRVPDEIAALPRPILGYFGLIARDWVDVDLLVHVALRFPDASLVMLGKATMDVSRLEGLPNVHLLGRKPYAELPAYCKGFDVALIPFPISEVTLNANPLKARAVSSRPVCRSSRLRSRKLKSWASAGSAPTARDSRARSRRGARRIQARTRRPERRDPARELGGSAGRDSRPSGGSLGPARRRFRRTDGR